MIPFRLARRRSPRHALISLAIGILIAGGGATSASAQPPTVEAGWFEVTSDHFTLYGPGRDELVTTSRDLEVLRALFSQIFPKATFTHLPTSIFVFADEAAFAPYALGRGIGYFQPHDHARYGAILANSVLSQQAVRKQFFHDLVHVNLPSLPLWLRHGLVEVYTYSDFVDGRARIGLPRDNLSLGVGVTVSDVLGLRELPTDPRRAAEVVGWSWLITHYLLIEDPERRQQLVDFVARNAISPVSLTESLGFDPEAFKSLLTKYRARQNWPIWIAEPPLDAIAEPRVEALSEARAIAHLADLLLHTGDESRRGPASEHAERALTLDPNVGLAHAVQGRLALLDNQPATAAKSLSRARELTPEAFQVHYWAALAELDALAAGEGNKRERLDTALAALRQALALDDQHAEAWARLGYALTLAEPPTQEAIDALVRARQMLPRRTQISLHLMLAFARLERVDEGHALLAELESRDVPAGALVQAREILHQMDFKRAVSLARDGQIASAAELFEAVAAGTTNDALRAQAEVNATKMRQRLAPR